LTPQTGLQTTDQGDIHLGQREERRVPSISLSQHSRSERLAVGQWGTHIAWVLGCPYICYNSNNNDNDNDNSNNNNNNIKNNDNTTKIILTLF
jgi:hypothetical protein